MKKLGFNNEDSENPVGETIRIEALATFVILISILLFYSACERVDLRIPGERAGTISDDSGRDSDKKTVERRASFLAVGDIMLSRGVDRAIKREEDPHLPFSKLKDLLLSSDFNFGNLESPVSGNDRILGRGLVFNADTRNLAALAEFNFKVVSLANNHALDQGLKGLVSTRSFLDRREIQYVGVGENKTDAWKPKIITANGIKIGFIGASYTSVNDGGASTNAFVARIEEIQSLKAAIVELKNRCDFIVVTMHAGVEYTRKPHEPQIVFARTAIDLGADIVIGSHPHWIQTFESYRGKYIFYSLGNFIFDQRKPETKEGLVLHITLHRLASENSVSRTGVEKIELIPVISELPGIPRRANAPEAKVILDKIGAKTAVIFP